MSEGSLEFEKPIVEIEKRIHDLRQLARQENMDVTDELHKLERKAEKLRKDIFSKLTRWQRVQLARHPQRPYTLDYVDRLTTDFWELHGDRLFADDPALVCGFATFEGRKVLLMGHQKGRDTKEKLRRNFGMAHPEGYRKSLRLMKLADKFGLPIVTFIDTPGAFPGIEAEERGQSRAIAENLIEMAAIRVPIVAVVIGEGGSGGALAIALADRVIMLENSVYSVISPEGCAAILWGDRSKAKDAAEALRISAGDLVALGIVDEVLPEPVGGAHRNPGETAETLKTSVKTHLD
ncbi:MAG: acetyl-CoA carboxylase carboxyltransferase subunit alpha, partial [Gemmatimonadetes bacterium]|nr:acetyl-CoA carboxylase carboxyltransferase subunit alpha [Gemmatimonadota bacterium]